MDDDDRYTRITLRLPKTLHAQLSAEADRTSKSLNAEIVGRLEKSISDQPAQPAIDTEAVRLMHRSNLEFRIAAARNVLVMSGHRLGEISKKVDAGVDSDDERRLLFEQARGIEAEIREAKTALETAMEELRAFDWGVEKEAASRKRDPSAPIGIALLPPPLSARFKPSKRKS